MAMVTQLSISKIPRRNPYIHSQLRMLRQPHNWWLLNIPDHHIVPEGFAEPGFRMAEMPMRETMDSAS